MTLAGDGHVHSEWSWDTGGPASDAVGRMRATCERAVRIGLSALVFTEHLDLEDAWHLEGPEDLMPHQRHHVDDDGYVRIPPLDVNGYLEAVERCRHAFPELRILTGVEFGQPHLRGERAAELLDLTALDRVNGSLHTLAHGDDRSEPNTLFRLWPPEAVVEAYLDEVPRMVAGSDAFAVFTHIDYAVRSRPTEAVGPFAPRRFEDPFRAAMRAIAASGRALELNTRRLWSWVPQWWSEEGGRAITFGSDAHVPEALAGHFPEAAAMAEHFGFRPGRRPEDLWNALTAARQARTSCGRPRTAVQRQELTRDAGVPRRPTTCPSEGRAVIPEVRHRRVRGSRSSSYAPEVEPFSSNRRRVSMLIAAVVILTVVDWSVGARPALAHEFSLALITPTSGSSNGGINGIDVRDGFRLAVEQSPDVSHPAGAEAGDHLGGIDVDVRVIDGTEAARAAEAVEQGVAGGLTAVVVIAAGPTAQAITTELEDSSLLLITAEGAGATAPAGAGALRLTQEADPPLDSGSARSVARAFGQAYGRELSAAAALGFDTGRLLDAAVAQADDGIEDVESVVAAALVVNDQLVSSKVSAPERNSAESARAEPSDASADAGTSRRLLVGAVGTAALLALLALLALFGWRRAVSRSRRLRGEAVRGKPQP